MNDLTQIGDRRPPSLIMEAENPLAVLTHRLPLEAAHLMHRAIDQQNRAIDQQNRTLRSAERSAERIASIQATQSASHDMAIALINSMQLRPHKNNHRAVTRSRATGCISMEISCW